MTGKLEIIKSFFDTYKDFVIPMIFCVGMLVLRRGISHAIFVLKQLEVLLSTVAPISVLLACLYCFLLLYSRYGGHAI